MLGEIVASIRKEPNFLLVAWWRESRLEDPCAVSVVLNADGLVPRAGLQEQAHEAYERAAPAPELGIPHLLVRTGRDGAHSPRGRHTNGSVRQNGTHQAASFLGVTWVRRTD